MDSYEGRNEDPLSLHKYFYCRNDPVNKTDASGHDFDIPTLSLDILNFAGWFCPVQSTVGIAYQAFGPHTQVGEILDSYFSPIPLERVWVMGSDDHYTGIVRKWQPVINAVKLAKDDLGANAANWSANHTTTPSWKPAASYAADPRSWSHFVQSPPGTDPATAGRNFSIWRTTGFQTEGLYTSAIGSFTVYATLDNPSTMKFWMFNLMSKKSFGSFASFFPNAAQANQWMWWNWTETVSFGP
jgi:hypothetical protein